MSPRLPLLIVVVMVFVFIMVVDAEQCPGESQDFAEGDKDGVVDFAARRNDKTGNQQAAAYCNEGKGIKMRRSMFRMMNLPFK